MVKEYEEFQEFQEMFRRWRGSNRSKGGGRDEANAIPVGSPECEDRFLVRVHQLHVSLNHVICPKYRMSHVIFFKKI